MSSATAAGAPLAGARVLVTRSVSRSGDIVTLLEALGGLPIVVPVTILAPPDPSSASEVVAAAARLDRYDWVLVTSKNAAERWLAALGSQPLDRIRWACVGSVTAAALRAAGITLALPPARDGTALAEAILAGEAVAGAHVLVPRAAGGRDELVVALRQAGATVDVVVLYQSVTAPATDPAVVAGLAALRAREVDVAIFFAPSQVAALFELLGPDATEILTGCRLVAAIGATTQAALVARGVTVAVVPARPDVAELASLVAERYQEEPY